MGIDAVALVLCRDPALQKALAKGPLGPDFQTQLGEVMAAAQRGEPAPMPVSLSFLGAGEDCVRLFTGVRFGDLQADPVLAQMLAHRILEVLPAGAHEADELVFYPDVASPRGRTHAAIVAELERALVRAPVAPVDDARRRTWEQARLEEEAKVTAEIDAARDAGRAEVYFAERQAAQLDAARNALRAELDQLGVFAAAKEGEPTLGGLRVVQPDGSLREVPPIHLKNAAQLLHPDLRPTSWDTEGLAAADEALIQRMQEEASDPTWDQLTALLEEQRGDGEEEEEEDARAPEHDDPEGDPRRPKGS